MNKIYLKLLLLGCFPVFFSGCGGVATISPSGEQRIISNKEFNEELAEQEKKRQLKMYKKLLPLSPREVIYTDFFKGNRNSVMKNYNSVDYNSLTAETDKFSGKTTDFNTERSSTVKYRRSSLYTLMIADTLDQYHCHQTKYIFAESRLPEKFNDHNIGPYQILGKAGNPNQALNIEYYLNKNNTAKQLVAKWFNRSSDGSFNMDLVGKRGEYNASELDIKIALHTKRGKALLKDAGEELIGNTFVVVYDFENIDNQRKIAPFKNAVKSNITINAYLYRLVWDDATAAVFYNDYWMDKNSVDPSRKAAFDKSNIFKLKYIGSVVIEEKSNTGMIEHSKEQVKKMEKKTIDLNDISLSRDDVAIKNALNVCLNELQREYEEFRIKFPLYSGDPIAAKVGRKEGIKEGDKFEVLEQLLHEDGTTEYHRMGTIKVGKEEDIWDNTTQGDWFGDSSKLEYTIFQGQKKKYDPGMLIRQIN